jgi:hypothetical protein
MALDMHSLLLIFGGLVFVGAGLTIIISKRKGGFQEIRLSSSSPSQ